MIYKSFINSNHPHINDFKELILFKFNDNSTKTHSTFELYEVILGKLEELDNNKKIEFLKDLISYVDFRIQTVTEEEKSNDLMAGIFTSYPDWQILKNSAKSLLEQLNSINQMSGTNRFQFTDNKNASKTDLIRVFDALYKLGVFHNMDGSKPDKNEFFEALGIFFSIDFKDFHKLKSSSKNSSVDSRIAIFDRLKNYELEEDENKK